MLITPVNNKTKQMKYLHFRLLVTIICCFMLVNGISFSTATLSQARSSLAATSVGKFALFGGGSYGSGYSNVVDIFDSSTRTWSTATLSQARMDLAATSVGNFALFGGGFNTFSGASNVVDIFDYSTQTWSTATLSEARSRLAATSVGNFALFAGGYNSGNGPLSNVIDIFDSSTQTWSTTTLSQARDQFAATSVGKYALFAGGDVGTYSNVVDIFDSSTQTWSTATLSQGRSRLAATSVGNFALFGSWNVVDIFDSSTQTWSTATLSQGRYLLTATSVGKYALFAGGYSSGSTNPSNVIDIFDSSTQTWSTTTLSQARGELAATSVGNFALFAGGDDDFPYGDFFYNVVDIFDILELTALASSPAMAPTELNESPIQLISPSLSPGPSNQLQSIEMVWIAGPVIGGVVFIGGVIIGAIFISRRIKRKRKYTNTSTGDLRVEQSSSKDESKTINELNITEGDKAKPRDEGFWNNEQIPGLSEHPPLTPSVHGFSSLDSPTNAPIMTSNPTGSSNLLDSLALSTTGLNALNTFEPAPANTNIQSSRRSSVLLNNNSWTINSDEISFTSPLLAKYMNRYTVDKEGHIVVGQGGFGTVFLVEFNKTIAVLKRIVPLKAESESVKLEFERECNLLKSLRHPNIVSFIGANTSSNDIFMVTEFMEHGDLFGLISKHDQNILWNNHGKDIALQVATGLTHLHKNNIIHRDIKSLNVLIGRGYVAKISDVGLSKVKIQTETHVSSNTRSFSLLWASPEQMNTNESVSFPSDIFSFGMVMWELVTQKTPFSGLQSFQIMMTIAQRTPIEKFNPIPSDCDPTVAKLIKSCWSYNPKQRPTADQCVDILSQI